MNKKEFEQWCRDYNINERYGMGSGCSYNRLYEWCEPLWEHLSPKIKQLKEQNANLRKRVSWYHNRLIQTRGESRNLDYHIDTRKLLDESCKTEMRKENNKYLEGGKNGTNDF